MVLFFPGQGSQFLGMGRDLVDKYPIAREIFHYANDILGYNIQDLCFNGPMEDLTNTVHAQPALLVYHHILTTLLRQNDVNPVVAVGHSLGEFSAILASGMVDFSSALKMVQQRGILMDAADPQKKGSMAAIIGLDNDTVINVCQDVSQEYYVEPVNFNTPKQVVISGLKEGVTRASSLLLQHGARKIVPLAVSGAFHSKLMEESAEKFSQYLTKITFKKPEFLIISNVTALFYDEDTVKTLLPLQMKSPVQWVNTIELLVKKEFTSGIEVSSGNMMQGMVRKIYKDFIFHPVSSILN